MRRIHDTNLVFVHIPKNAGQAVTNCFGCEHRSSDHSLSKSEDLLFMRPPFIRFAVIRDPVQRFVSAYKYQCHMQRTNFEKVPVRQLIADEKLGEDINTFVECIQDKGFDLQSDMWFRRQIHWLRRAKPQITLRLENLESDLEIVRQIVPEHFRGLQSVNASEGRPRSDKANVKMSERSLKFVSTFYEKDFFYLSYPKPDF